jgi:DNA-binding NarL/FixJ family response regulator
MSKKNIKVTIVEDHDMTRMGLSFALSNSGDIEVAGTAADGLEGIEQAMELKPDLVVMDIGLPTVDGIEATRKIKNSLPDMKVLMYTSRDNEDDILDSFQAGADGYITKGATSEQTISAIKAVCDGLPWIDPAIARVVLSNIRKNSEIEGQAKGINYKKGKNLYGLTEREMEVLALLVEGLNNPQISKKLVITIATTKTHVHNILQKLYVKTRSKAVATAMKDGLV